MKIGGAADHCKEEYDFHLIIRLLTFMKIRLIKSQYVCTILYFFWYPLDGVVYLI